MARILIEFPHGLGDTAQLTVVLQHLQHYRPDWELFVKAQRGKHTAALGYCTRVWHDQEPNPDHAFFDVVYELDWWECYTAYPTHPSTKACNCLREVFGITPDSKLLKYKIHITPESTALTKAYLERVGCRLLENGRFNAVVLHYQGNTSTQKKNISHESAFGICRTALASGYVPIILDWDNRSPLPSELEGVYCPNVHAHDIWGAFGSGDAERISALVEQCSAFIGIDSGPQKCAGATSTPSIGVWTGHHPIQFFDICNNFLHILPEDWRNVPPAQNGACAQYFEREYSFKTYKPGELTFVICKELNNILGKPTLEKDDLWFCDPFWIRKSNADQDLVIVRDVYFGDAYRTKTLPSNEWNNEQFVVDVGACFGAFASLVHKLNPRAKIVCIEACPDNIPVLQANVGKFADIVTSACTYEEDELALLNAVRQNCESTGGSIVVKKSDILHAPKQTGYQYWHDHRPIEKVTLEEVMRKHGKSEIDLLKLDCEGSEYSILGNTPSFSKIRYVVGEYHDEAKWFSFMQQERFQKRKFTPLFRDGYGFTGLFQWAPEAAPTLVPGILKVAVPPGIGDALWSLMKIPALLKHHGVNKAVIGICQSGPPYRSKEFLEMFDFVDHAVYRNLSCIETTIPWLPDGSCNWAPSQKNWHNEFDYMLQANSTLEKGERIETWLPEFPTDFDIMDRFHVSGKGLRMGRRACLGPYCCLYFSNLVGNTTMGHNRNGLWSPDDWKELIRSLIDMDLFVHVLGAEWDKDYLRTYLPELEDWMDVAIDVGELSIEETVVMLSNSKFFIGYQSGLGVISTLLGVPTAMWWRPEGDSIYPDKLASFSEDMSHAWVPKRQLENHKYLPLIYGKHAAGDIIKHAKRFWM